MISDLFVVDLSRSIGWHHSMFPVPSGTTIPLVQAVWGFFRVAIKLRNSSRTTNSAFDEDYVTSLSSTALSLVWPGTSDKRSLQDYP